MAGTLDALDWKKTAAGFQEAHRGGEEDGLKEPAEATKGGKVQTWRIREQKTNQGL
jgi:hypothetical protein